jgi:hypothetical protein
MVDFLSLCLSVFYNCDDVGEVDKQSIQKNQRKLSRLQEVREGVAKKIPSKLPKLEKSNIILKLLTLRLQKE